MVIIYLDQNAISEIALALSGTPWALIREEIIALSRDKAVECPIPIETILESAACNKETRDAIDEIFRSVSSNRAFKSLANLLIEHALEMVRPGITVEKFVVADEYLARDEKAILTTRYSHANMRDRMKQRAKASAQRPMVKTLTPAMVMESFSCDHCGMFFRDINRFLEKTEGARPDYEIPWLIEELINNRITRDEACQLRKAIVRRDWEKTPVLYYFLLLGSTLEYQRERGCKRPYKANDEIDIWRAAVALNSADIFITDKYVVQLCRDSKMADLSPTELFSVNNTTAILKRLGQIREKIGPVI